MVTSPSRPSRLSTHNRVPSSPPPSRGLLRHRQKNRREHRPPGLHQGLRATRMSPLLVLHVVVSLVGLATGLVVVYGLIRDNPHAAGRPLSSRPRSCGFVAVRPAMLPLDTTAVDGTPKIQGLFRDSNFSSWPSSHAISSMPARAPTI